MHASMLQQVVSATRNTVRSKIRKKKIGLVTKIPKIKGRVTERWLRTPVEVLSERSRPRGRKIGEGASVLKTQLPGGFGGAKETRCSSGGGK